LPAHIVKSLPKTEPIAGPYTLAGYCAEESVGFLIKRVRMALSSSIDREMASSDISHDQWSVLILMSSGRGDTAAELSREAGVDTGSMTRMIDRLEAKGLVIRTRSADDRRVVRLALTPAGRSLCDRMPDVMVRVLNRHLAGFSGAELEQLKNFLRRMLSNAAVPLNPE
jgi:DNA-binding MarR family transcriptional regulator